MSAPCPTLGFHLSFTIAPRAAAGRGAAVREAFLQLVAHQGLVAEAAAGGQFDFVITGDGTQATESDRQRIIAWLDGNAEVAGHRAGPLIDIAERV